MLSKPVIKRSIVQTTGIVVGVNERKHCVTVRSSEGDMLVDYSGSPPPHGKVRVNVVTDQILGKVERHITFRPAPLARVATMTPV